GRTEGALRREGEDTVVAPVALARVLTQRHQLYGGHTQFLELGQALADAIVAPHRGGVQLIDDGLVPGPAAPVVVAPDEGARIVHAAGAIDPLRLIAGRRVGYRNPVVDQKLIMGSRPAQHPRAVPALILMMKAVNAAVPQADRHAAGVGRPQREDRAAVRLDGGTVHVGQFAHASALRPWAAMASV